MYEIEDSVPLPKIARGGNREAQYPFAGMRPGQSFWVPKRDDMTIVALAKSISACMRGYVLRDKSPYRFAVRSYPDGVRCWCVAAKESAIREAAE